MADNDDEVYKKLKPHLDRYTEEQKKAAPDPEKKKKDFLKDELGL